MCRCDVSATQSAQFGIREYSRVAERCSLVVLSRIALIVMRTNGEHWCVLSCREPLTPR